MERSVHRQLLTCSWLPSLGLLQVLPAQRPSTGPSLGWINASLIQLHSGRVLLTSTGSLSLG